jgi:hypothetical protein
MMSNPNTIDIIATDPETGKLLLVMTEDRPWNSAVLHQQFLAKVNVYLNYVLSDQFVEDQPGFGPTKVIIKLDAQSHPGKTPWTFSIKPGRNCKNTASNFNTKFAIRNPLSLWPRDNTREKEDAGEKGNAALVTLDF